MLSPSPRDDLRARNPAGRPRESWKERPDGLLLHEDSRLVAVPAYLGMRQYWRDIDSLERWTRSEPRQRWWRDFLRDSGGTGFWHEAYFMGGRVEAIYDDYGRPDGLRSLRPDAGGTRAMFSARQRVARPGPLTVAPVVSEAEYYGATAEDGEPNSTPAA